MKAKEIFTEIDIEAPVEKVWSVLTDFENYSKWNHTITSISGTLSKGSTLDISMYIPHHKDMLFHAQVTKVEENKEIRWVGKKALGGLGTIEGEQVLRLKKDGEFKTSFYNTEFFTGLFLGMVWGKISYDTQVAFERMNEALKKRCEH